MVELDLQDARVALEITDLMSGPLGTDDVVKVIRMAKYLTPVLEAAFAKAGVDPNEVDFPEMPKLAPGSDYKG